MKRLWLAIIAAILINFILASGIDHLFHTNGVYPPYGVAYFDTELYLLALGYRTVITIFAAYVTAVIAKEEAKKALMITGILGTVLWLAGTIAAYGLGPLWYGLVGAALSIPLVLIGGKLYEIRTKNAAGAP